jgi:hypothetical protein
MTIPVIFARHELPIVAAVVIVVAASAAVMVVVGTKQP